MYTNILDLLFFFQTDFCCVTYNTFKFEVVQWQEGSPELRVRLVNIDFSWFLSRQVPPKRKGQKSWRSLWWWELLICVHLNTLSVLCPCSAFTSSIFQETQTEGDGVEKNNRQEEQSEQQPGEKGEQTHCFITHGRLHRANFVMVSFLSFFFLVLSFQGVKKQLKRKHRRNQMYVK